MKPSKRNVANAVAKAEKRAAGKLKQSKYAAKVAAEIARLNDKEKANAPRH